MKIFIQYPWKVSDSMYYKSLVKNPPKGIDYISLQKRQGMITNPTIFSILSFCKRHIRELIEKTKLPILNMHKTTYKGNYDLIHCAHNLPKNIDKPWVVDFESKFQLWISGRDTQEGYDKALKSLMSNNCKKVLAWTEYVKQDIISLFPQIKDKVVVVSYAMKQPKIKKIEHNTINLLFVGRYFKEKGGLHALEVFDKLTKKYDNVECLFVSKTPQKIIEKYSSNTKISFFDLMPHQILLDEIISKTDILVQPGYSDTFGFIFVEAPACGIPVVTVDGFSRKDVINEGKTGFIIDRKKNTDWYPSEDESEKIIEKMIDKTSLLIENSKLREEMGKNGRQLVIDGKFSIRYRNNRLLKVYEEALK